MILILENCSNRMIVICHYNYFKVNIPHYVAGVDEFNNATLALEEAFVDNHRIDYHRDNLNVKGYLALDNVG